MAAIRLPKPRLMRWAGVAISDHNRSELSMDVEQIETKKRMANGLMRKYHVADKYTFSTSWSMLPNSALWTVDGFAGADDIEFIFKTTKKAFPLALSFSIGPDKVYQVMFTDFSKSLNKRGKFDMFDVNVTMEEV